MRFRVYLEEGQRVAEIFVSPATKCRDIVQRLQRQIHATGCFLLEVWQGCERLVPDSESILSTLLEWGSDLQDVKFYLQRREEAPPLRQVANGPLKVNGFKEDTPLSRDVLLGGGGTSVNDLKEFAARQQQEIAVKERELKAKQVQLMEMKRKSQKKSPNPYVQQLSAKVDEQSERLTALRHVQDQVESYKLSNSALAEELDSIRSLFMEKEKELAIAVAKVESLTQQLDKQRQGLSQSSLNHEKTHQQLELERLRKELMTRNELNHQQSVKIQSQKQLLAEKHKELFELDAQIEQYTEELRKKKSRNNHIDRENGSRSPTEEQEFLEMDYSNLGNFTKRGKTPTSADHKNGSASISSGSFRGRSRNSNKLETLLEVDEEVSDGHASNKSSTEDLTQGPGPPRASRVTALKSRFETQSTTEEYDKFWDAHDQLFNGAKHDGNDTAGKFAKGFPNPSRRVEPEGVENPAISDEERRASNSKEKKPVVADSLLGTKPCNEGVETKTGKAAKVEGTSFEFPQSLEIKHIISESELKTEESPWNSGRSSPSDGGNGSGLSSPSSLSSLSSTSSNSTSPKSAVFAVTGVAKKTEISRYPSGSPQYENTVPNRSVSVQQGFEERFKGNNLQPLKTGKKEPRRPQDEVLKARQVKSEAFPTRNDSVGSIIRPTVLDFSRAGMKPKPIGGANDSNNNKELSDLNEEKLKENDATVRREDREKSPSLTEDKARQYDVSSDRNPTKEAPLLTDEKTVASSVKAGNVKLSPLQYTTVFPPKTIEKHKTVDTALLQTSDIEDQVRRIKVSFGDSRRSVERSVEANLNETKTEANAISPSSHQNAISSSGLIQKDGEMMFSPSSGSSDTSFTSQEDRKTIEASGKDNRDRSELNAIDVNASGPSRKGKLEGSSLSMFSPGKTATLVGEEEKTEPSFKDSNSEAELEAAASRSLNNDRSDGNGEAQIPSLSSAQLNKDHKREQGRSIGDETDNAAEQKSPLIFKPISFRAKKLANEQRIDHTFNKPSQPAPLISNSISVRGQSSLAKITITPSSTFVPSAERDIPEKRSPVPTSKRPKFWNRVAPPTSPEEKDLLAISEFPGEENIRLNVNENHKEIVGKESFEEETAAEEDLLQNEEFFQKSKGRNKGQTEQSQSKTREESNTGAKQVVSSVNIQLSSQKRQPSQEVKEISSTKEPVTTVSQIIKGKDCNSDSSSKQGQIHFGSARLSSKTGRLNSESDKVDTRSSQLDTDNERSGAGGVSPERVYKSENVETTSEGSNTESQRRHAVNKNVSTSRLIKLSLPTQVSTSSEDNAQNKSAARESRSSVDADRSNVLSNGELSYSESPSPRTSPGGNRGCTVLEEAEHVTSSEHQNDEREALPVQGKSEQQNLLGLGLTENGVTTERGMLFRNQPPNKVETRQLVTSKDLKDIVKGDTGDITLVSRSENSISELSSATAADSNAKSTRSGDTLTAPVGLSNRIPDQLDDSSTSTMYQGQITSKELNSLLSARKTNRKKKAYRVSLDPHAVLLDAAVEGELDIVTQIVGEVDDPSKPNSEGITALHNAVCASHDEVVKFLVQYGCNINSQDSHGWTPLHCAAANNATDLSRFLIEHGACILAVTTLERKTPLQCCERGQPGFFNCTSYLNDIQQNFGLVNEGRVYALYSYSAIEEDELSFECGEELKVLRPGDATEKEWWWALNEKGDTGYIPRNLLGSHPRVSPEV